MQIKQSNVLQPENLETRDLPIDICKPKTYSTNKTEFNKPKKIW